MARADYAHIVDTINGRKSIAITDLDLGGTSVTNDIDNVVKEICSSEQLAPVNCIIVYRDSQGIIDGYDAKAETIVSLNENRWMPAIDKMFKKVSGNGKK